jgi:PAS domain-containing protein
MKTVCAWCGCDITLAGGLPAGDGKVSHGICLPCANRMIIQTPFDLRTFLDDVAVPVVLVDGEGVVRIANDKVLTMTGKGAEQVEGFSGGDVFQCIYARLPEGCGNTIHCSGCVIRRTVMETHVTGQTMCRVPATLMQQSGDGQQEIRFRISTEKMGDCVILRIDSRDDVGDCASGPGRER